ncbi:MAG: [Fe-Fe] hydrogenase large subunit C-terminal domain-containing protein [Bacteroidales bacterium]|jgi:PAS domain S-box-containing protein
MGKYLDFKDAQCKDCYKCLRACPVKAIDVTNHQAKIIDERCILCGTCTIVCPQNAKIVHSEKDNVKELIKNNSNVIASVAPSCISSFQITDFSTMKIALGKLGFADAEETALGAQLVVREYAKLMETGQFKNFIVSACPAVCKMIQMYYPRALKYLAPVDSPMIAHAKLIKSKMPDAKIVFIGPCIAKKREAEESHLIDGVLTFEDLNEMFAEKDIVLDDILTLNMDNNAKHANLAKAFPISHGIIQSFEKLPENYDYMSIDGADRCLDVLENIESISNVFIEMNVCKDACVNGPCSLDKVGGSIKATSEIRDYVNREKKKLPIVEKIPESPVDLSTNYERLRVSGKIPTEKEIAEILAKIGKTKPEDELNCGTCGYSTCREKAWAVFNGYADIEVCLPYMQQRAESFSYEIIRNSPEGLIVLDFDMNILEMNNHARKLLGVQNGFVKGQPAVELFNPTDFMLALEKNQHLERKKVFIPASKLYVDLSISIIKEHRALFGIMKDVTDEANYNEKLNSMRLETLETTDKVIKKQMFIAQEIASLLGETTAETKIALLKLKQMLKEEEEE